MPILRSWSEGNRVYKKPEAKIDNFTQNILEMRKILPTFASYSGFSFRQFYPNPELNFDKNTAKKLAF